MLRLSRQAQAPFFTKSFDTLSKLDCKGSLDTTRLACAVVFLIAPIGTAEDRCTGACQLSYAARAGEPRES